MAKTDALAVEMLDEVAVVRFQNPEGLNSFGPETLASMHTTFTDLLGDEAAKAIVLTGSGDAFSVGADVAEFKARLDAGDITPFILTATEHLHPTLRALHESHKPFVAAVNGVAAGGGLGLALAADARLGAPEARFAAGYFGIGASPDGGATWFMPRLIGEQRTRRFFFDNQVMDADQAVACGLLDQIVPADDLVDEAVALAKRWAMWSRHSIEATKRLLSHQSQNGLQSQLDLERGLIAAAGATPGFREGIIAFQEKRKPKFS